MSQFKTVAMQLAAKASDDMWPLCLVYWNRKVGGFQVAYHLLGTNILKEQGDAIKNAINEALKDVEHGGPTPGVMIPQLPRPLSRKERRARASKQARKR